jgi:hypothetical protein
LRVSRGDGWLGEGSKSARQVGHAVEYFDAETVRACGSRNGIWRLAGADKGQASQQNKNQKP